MTKHVMAGDRQMKGALFGSRSGFIRITRWLRGLFGVCMPLLEL